MTMSVAKIWEFFLLQAVIFEYESLILQYYFTYFSAFFSPFIYNTQI